MNRLTPREDFAMGEYFSEYPNNRSLDALSSYVNTYNKFPEGYYPCEAHEHRNPKDILEDVWVLAEGVGKLENKAEALNHYDSESFDVGVFWAASMLIYENGSIHDARALLDLAGINSLKYAKEIGVDEFDLDNLEEVLNDDTE